MKVATQNYMNKLNLVDAAKTSNSEGLNLTAMTVSFPHSKLLTGCDLNKESVVHYKKKFRQGHHSGKLHEHEPTMIPDINSSTGCSKQFTTPLMIYSPESRS